MINSISYQQWLCNICGKLTQTHVNLWKSVINEVQIAIINLTKNRTTLVIAHRLSTIIRADKIIVLNQGKIVETGSHTELLNNSNIYKNLYSKQISAN